MKNRSMFPYRRGAGKKRAQNNGRRGRDGGGRRSANSPQELLSLMQPATKALAQVLVGNTRPSGQLVHARNVLEQADQMIQERAVDRVPPQVREDFLEQLARLKLTISDAAELEDGELQSDAVPEEPVEKKQVAPERLRELALRLAVGSPLDQNDSMMDDASQEESDSSSIEGSMEDSGSSAGDVRDEREPASPKTGVRASKLRLNVPKDDVTAADA